MNLVATLAVHAQTQEFSLDGGGGGGVQVNLTKTADSIFLVLCLSYSSQMVYFKENYYFSRFQRGSNIFQGGGGGVQLSKGGGGTIAFPYRSPYNLWFSRGGSRPPVPPLDSHLLSSTAHLSQWKKW